LETIYRARKNTTYCVEGREHLRASFACVEGLFSTRLSTGELRIVK